MAQGTQRKKVERPWELKHQEVFWETVSWRWLHKQDWGHDNVNELVMWKGGIFQGPTPRQKNYRQLMNAGITLSLWWASYGLSNAD